MSFSHNFLFLVRVRGAIVAIVSPGNPLGLVGARQSRSFWGESGRSLSHSFLFGGPQGLGGGALVTIFSLGSAGGALVAIFSFGSPQGLAGSALVMISLWGGCEEPQSQFSLWGTPGHGILDLRVFVDFPLALQQT